MEEQTFTNLDEAIDVLADAIKERKELTPRYVLTERGLRERENANEKIQAALRYIVAED